MSDNQLAPIEGADFAARMALFGPFESAPRIAIAVSGGADSMALALLAHEWVRGQGGEAVALIVDHGLRSESAVEVAQVADWLRARGLTCRCLTWTGPKPETGLLAAARQARYDLLDTWCREAGILHLLLAHHRRDQAETVLIRESCGSAADGLSGMSAVIEAGAVRRLRPFLGTGPGRLRATLEARGQPWVEDPSNHNRAFARVRARHRLIASDDEERLVEEAREHGRVRIEREAATARQLATRVAIHPAGFAVLDGLKLAEGDQDLARRVLAGILSMVRGRVYPPRREKVLRLVGRIAKQGKETQATLAGCRMLPWGKNLLVCREARGLPEPRVLSAGETLNWDRRFRIEVAQGGDDLRLLPLEMEGWRQVVEDKPDLRGHFVPPVARVTLPAVYDNRGVLAVPHLGYKRSGERVQDEEILRVAFDPANSASGLGFCVA